MFNSNTPPSQAERLFRILNGKFLWEH